MKETCLRAPTSPTGLFYLRSGKRMLDLALALPVLVLVAPLLLVLAALVRSNLGAPVFFRQERVGLGEQLFACTSSGP